MFQLLDDLHTSTKFDVIFFVLSPSFHHIPSSICIWQLVWPSEASDIYVGEEGKDLVSQSLQGKSEVRQRSGCHMTNQLETSTCSPFGKLTGPRRLEDVHFFFRFIVVVVVVVLFLKILKSCSM